MNSAISITAVGKQYLIRHQQPYQTLRDLIVNLFTFSFLRSKKNSEIFSALKEVSFEVSPKEIVGIIGKNGSGKSTLLKIISKITPPTSGEIRLRGRVGSLLEVGTGFHPELTGRDNVYLSGAILGMSRKLIRKHFDEIVAFAEIAQFIDTPVKHYSSGMYVRLAFAVAVFLESDILLVDEVLAVGDLAFQEKCLKKMEQINRGGRTVLFVSHDMSAIRSLCSRVIWLDKGSVIKDGSPEEVISAYERIALSLDAGGAGFVERSSPPAREIWIQSVELKNKDKRSSRFGFGETIGARIQLGRDRRDLVGDYYLTWELCDDSGLLLSSGSTRADKFSLAGDKNGISLDLGPLPLYAGVYMLNLSLGIADDPRLCDYWRGDIRFVVDEADPLGHGDQHRGRESGIFHLPATWNTII